jgi:MFS family permease
MYAVVYFKANTLEVGLLSSMNSLTTLLLTIPGGLASDRFGRKIMLIMSMVLNAASFVFAYTAIELLMLTISVILSGASYANFGPTMQSLVADLATADVRKKAVGLYTVASSVGFFIGPAMCSLLLQFISIKDVFLIALGITSIELIMGILVVKEKGSSGGEARFIVKNLSSIIHNTNVMHASLALVSFFFVDSCIMAFFPIIALNVYGLTPQIVSSVFMIRNLALLSSRTLVVTRMAGKFSEKKLFSISLALPVSLVLSFFLPGYIPLAILIVIAGAALGIIYPMGAMIVAESTSQQERGLANAVYYVGMNVGVTVSPIMMGVVANMVGITMIFPIVAFAPVIGLLVSSRIKTK